MLSHSITLAQRISRPCDGAATEGGVGVSVPPCSAVLSSLEYLPLPDYGYGPYAYGPGPYVYGPGYGGSAVAYCMQRFRSYDPGSGTYLGYDGYRHPCP